MNKKRLYRTIPAIILILSMGAITTYAETTGTTYRYIDGSSYTYNSQGMLTITNEQDNSQSAVIDTNDIYANAAAIEDIQKKLTGLGGGNLGYDNTSNTYYIDIDGDGSLNEDSDVLIGAVGSATTDMVLEGYTFSSQEAGVNKSGTMVDVLSHNNVLTAGVYTPSGSDNDLTDGSISLAEGGSTLSEGATDLNVGVGESVTLPSGYYSSDVTVGNGVVNRGSLKSVILTSSNNTVTLEAGYYDTFTVSTDISTASGTITYSHHQCSSTIAGDTYEDAYPDARGAQEVTGLTKVNGVTVSTTSAGCYTKPYYYYKYTASRQVANGYDDCIVCKGSSVADSCTEGFTKKDGCTPHTVYKTEYYDAYAYGSDLPSGASIQATYYTKGCGYANGQIVSATITY